MKIISASHASAPYRLILVFEDDKNLFGPLVYNEKPGKPEEAKDKAAFKIILAQAKDSAKLKGFTGKKGELLSVTVGQELILFFGMGSRKNLTQNEFCLGWARAIQALRPHTPQTISLELPEKTPWSAEVAARCATEAAAMAAYVFDHYRTSPPKELSGEKGKNSPGLTKIEVVHRVKAEAKAVKKGVDAGNIVAEGIALSQDLINHPASTATTDYMVSQAHELAKSTNAKIKVIAGDKLAQEGYGAIHAVGRSGSTPPALVTLEYGKPGKNTPTLALVGKGVVFDSGGLNLKPGGSMALMKKDMGGSAIVLGAFAAIAKLKLPLHLVAVVGLAENGVGPIAFRPGDVLQTKGGPTVEVTNTDAEGRLVLADALSLALTYKPTYMVDFATLTGAARVALGKDIMALFSDNKPLLEKLLAAGEATGEPLWQLPLWAGYRKNLESPIADMVNATSDGMAGAITAALFLKEFVGDVAWAHLDCYGWSDGSSPLYPRGGSGQGVRLMVEMASRLN